MRSAKYKWEQYGATGSSPRPESQQFGQDREPEPDLQNEGSDHRTQSPNSLTQPWNRNPKATKTKWSPVKEEVKQELTESNLCMNQSEPIPRENKTQREISKFRMVNANPYAKKTNENL